MLIRPSGHHDGVKEYLEDGRKVGRELGRDDLDERVVLAGDLDLTDAVIQSIDAAPNVDRYLSITLSFKEDHVDRETLFQIARDFEAFALHAYRPDEYCFYAEAHLPRVKSYLDKSSGELVERKPHIHVVIPKRNLISGQTLRPFGFDKQNLHFIDAFQEHTNAKYGLASPKDNRRTLLTDASEMISRYRGDLFRANSRELKEKILDSILDRQIESYADFIALLREHGSVRMRNAGRDDAYPNVRPAGADKGVNLKDTVFTPEFIELTTVEKLQALSADAADRYEAGVAKRRTPDDITAVLDEWYASRARELKYLNSGGRLYQQYQESSPNDRELMLAELERGFYAQHLKAHHDRADDTIPGLERDLRRHGSVFEFGAQPADAVDGFDEREIDLDAPRWKSNWEAEDVPTAGIDGFDRLGGQFDFVAIAPQSSPESFDDLHGLPGRAVDGLGHGPAVLLPDHALCQLEPDDAVPANRVRRRADRAGEPATQRLGSQARVELDAYHRALEAHYAFGDPFERLPPMRPPLARAPSGMSPPGWFEGRRRDPFLDQFDAIGPALDFDTAGPILRPEMPDRRDRKAAAYDRQLIADGFAALEQRLRQEGRAYEFGARPHDAVDQFDDGEIDLEAFAWQCGWDGDDTPGRVIDRFDTIGDAFEFEAAAQVLLEEPEILADAPAFRSRRSHAGDEAFTTPRRTGRTSDNVLCQLARQVRERREASSQYEEFREIRQGLDARRLLAELSYTHGVRPAKYVIVAGRDGIDRIRAGKRSLNVSDFLTKELNLSWREAAPMLREIYQRQQAGEPIPAPRELPRAALWREYSGARESHIAARSAAWLAQRASEQVRRDKIRTAFETRRDAIKQDVRLAPAGRRAATSLARAERLSREDALRESIADERAALNAQFGPSSGPSFSDWLRTRAEQGDERALAELRRTARPASVDDADQGFSVIRPTAARLNAGDDHNAIIFRSACLSWSVDDRGTVTYRQDGRDVVRDRGASVQVLYVDRSAIEAGLRLAQSKFGSTLELAGNDDHQLAAARVAVDAGLRVQFSDARLNRAMDKYRHTRVDQHVRDVLGDSSPAQLTNQRPQQQADRPEQSRPGPSDETKPTV
ncbi:LPD7 domain-containing protein [Trinickia dabaoshanensis]|uniref:LPD7 domain-containing protein n=1 Tax=Trinickia dabaoshanensis TaxID=564714 RepID=UPI001E53B829|nr:LPD7 domain-containing protein [Trinickia dabaoshanensis]